MPEVLIKPIGLLLVATLRLAAVNLLATCSGLVHAYEYCAAEDSG